MKYDKKTIICEQHEISNIISAQLEEWISTLLIRMRVDAHKIERAKTDIHFSKRAWRSHLFYEHGVDVIKHPDKIIISKHFSDRPVVILGEWREPTIIRFVEGSKTKCKLCLNYWQIV